MEEFFALLASDELQRQNRAAALRNSSETIIRVVWHVEITMVARSIFTRYRPRCLSHRWPNRWRTALCGRSELKILDSLRRGSHVQSGCLRRDQEWCDFIVQLSFDPSLFIRSQLVPAVCPIEFFDCECPIRPPINTPLATPVVPTHPLMNGDSILSAFHGQILSVASRIKSGSIY